MKGSLAAILRALVLPFGATSGQRIELDGINGQITVYDASNAIVATIRDPGLIVGAGIFGARIELDGSGANPSLLVINSSGDVVGSLTQQGGLYVTEQTGLGFSVRMSGTSTDSRIAFDQPTAGGQTFQTGYLIVDNSGATEYRPRTSLSSPNILAKAFARMRLIGAGATDANTYLHSDALHNVFDGPVEALDTSGATAHTPEPWRTPSYAANWSAGNGRALRYRKVASPGSGVQIIGQAHVGGVYTGTIFTLPAGYRPQTYQVIMACRDNGAAFAAVVVNTDGTVVHQGPATTGVDWCFNAIIQTDI